MFGTYRDVSSMIRDTYLPGHFVEILPYSGEGGYRLLVDDKTYTIPSTTWKQRKDLEDHILSQIKEKYPELLI